jgi:RimJ/RimL family protein N-acetyltransferase
VERLETAALVLRPPMEEDAPAAYALLNDPDVRLWNPGRECPDL